jgi:hypothetical protein
MGSADLMYSLLDLYVTIEDPLITSSSKQKKKSIQIFPNPTEGFLSIQTKNPSVANVFDRSGRLVLSKMLNLTIQQIDLSELANGLYTVEIIGDNETQMSKIIKK